jgi:Holliday junction DNA helicase RuvA
MIAFLDGVVASRGADHVVLDVGGIGFLLRTSSRTSEGIGSIGATAHVHTCLLVRDESPVLYGFTSEDERSFFLDLISVSGVGPRVALSLLSALRPDELAGAVARNDTALLSHVPGVGKKIAARLCVELQPKVQALVLSGASRAGEGDGELVAALMGLGYTLREASEAARAVGSEAGESLEARLRIALRALTKA